MYGQSNLFVSPNITYGIFKKSPSEFLLITRRSARNMAFQSQFEKWGEVVEVATISGKDVIGTQVHAPLSQFGKVYVVPMDTIKENKGTGVVTSVPSDSPDDFVMNRDLAKKPEFYGIQQRWVVSISSIRPSRMHSLIRSVANRASSYYREPDLWKSHVSWFRFKCSTT
jgi:leucyl-tRNA synthetase